MVPLPSSVPALSEGHGQRLLLGVTALGGHGHSLGLGGTKALDAVWRPRSLLTPVSCGEEWPGQVTPDPGVHPRDVTSGIKLQGVDLDFGRGPGVENEIGSPSWKCSLGGL